jgi:hypothetical protein
MDYKTNAAHQGTVKNFNPNEFVFDLDVNGNPIMK